MFGKGMWKTLSAEKENIPLPFIPLPCQTANGPGTV